MIKLYIVAFAIILLGGCSTASPIQKVNMSKSAFDDALLYKGRTAIINDGVSDQDAYRIYHRAATGFVSVESIRRSAVKRANEFCGEKDQVMQVLEERTSGPFLPGNWPRIELVFVCAVDPNSSYDSKGADKYAQLSKLKSLLDNGVITEKEFVAEKTKLLS